MGKTHPETPIGSQLVLMPAQPSEGEISLTDLFRMLVKHKAVFWAVFLLVVVAGITFAIVTETRYLHRASIAIGSIPDEDGFERIEQPETVLAKVSEDYIPRVISTLSADQSDNEHSIALKARFPKGSNIVIVEGEAPLGMSEFYLELIGQVLTLVTADHDQLIGKMRTSLEERLTEVQLQIEELEKVRSLLDQRMETATTTDGQLGVQIQALREQIEAKGARLAEAQGEVTGEPSTVAPPSIDDALAGDRRYLLNLEEEQRRWHDWLSAEISLARQDLQDKRLFALQLQKDLDILQETRPVQKPMRLRTPAGPNRILIVALAGLLGLLLAAMAAFFSEFLSKTRASLADIPDEVGV